MAREYRPRAPGLGARPPRLPPLRRVSRRDVRRPLHERRLRLPDRVHPARGLRRDGRRSAATTSTTRSRTSGSRRRCSSWSASSARAGSSSRGACRRVTWRPTCSARSTSSTRPSPRTSAAPATSSSGARCRSSCSARSSSSSRSRTDAAPGSSSPLSVALAVVVSFGFRFLVNLCVVLAARLPRPGADRDRDQPRALRDDHPALRSSRRRSTRSLRLTPFAAILQAPIDIFVGDPVGGSVALVLALQAHLGGRALRPRALRARGRHAQAGGAGWLSCARGSTCGSSARGSARSSSTGSRRRSRSSARCSSPPSTSSRSP